MILSVLDNLFVVEHKDKDEYFHSNSDGITLYKLPDDNIELQNEFMDSVVYLGEEPNDK